MRSHMHRALIYTVWLSTYLTSPPKLVAQAAVPVLGLRLDVLRSYTGTHNVVRREHMQRAGQTRRSSAPSEPDVVEQVLDHFADNQDRESVTWAQRYFLNASVWGGPGYPIFLLLGGEGPVEGPEGAFSLLGEMATRHAALMVTLEHRFYGESQPFDDLGVQHLKYLNSQQALGDAAYFIQYLSQKLGVGDGTKWVAFGGSYAGALAAWLRVQYPHLVVGSVASSAPVHAQLDFYQYNAGVTRSLRQQGGEACVQVVSNASYGLNAMLRSKEGRLRVQRLFQTCGPIANFTIGQEVMGDIMTVLQARVQYDTRQHTGIAGTCRVGVAELERTGDAVRALAAMLENLKGEWFFPQPGCLGPAGNTTGRLAALRALGETRRALNGSLRQWYYQLCNEFGQQGCEPRTPGCGDARTALDCFAGFQLGELKDDLHMCAEVYNVTALPPAAWTGQQVGWTNVRTGGYATLGSCLVFVNGDLDPYHTVSVTPATLTPAQQALGVEAILIANASHCADMGASSDEDDNDMRHAKRQVMSIVSSWLGVDDIGTTVLSPGQQQHLRIQ